MKKLTTLMILSFIGINAFAFCGSQWDNQSYAQCRQNELLQEQNQSIRSTQPTFPSSQWAPPQRQQQCYRNAWGQVQCY
jgi:hypothetical protein